MKLDVNLPASICSLWLALWLQSRTFHSHHGPNCQSWQEYGFRAVFLLVFEWTSIVHVRSTKRGTALDVSSIYHLSIDYSERLQPK